MSVKTNVLAYTFFKYTPSCVASGRKYVDSCGNKGLDETRRSQTERLISRPRKAQYFSEAMNAHTTSFVFCNQCLVLFQPHKINLSFNYFLLSSGGIFVSR